MDVLSELVAYHLEVLLEEDDFLWVLEIWLTIFDITHSFIAYFKYFKLFHLI